MPGGVREHIPVISVEGGEVEYAKFAYNKENDFSVCLICHHCSRAKTSEGYLPEAASLFFFFLNFYGNINWCLVSMEKD